MAIAKPKHFTGLPLRYRLHFECAKAGTFGSDGFGFVMESPDYIEFLEGRRELKLGSSERSLMGYTRGNR